MSCLLNHHLWKIKRAINEPIHMWVSWNLIGVDFPFNVLWLVVSQEGVWAIVCASCILVMRGYC